MDDVSLKQQKQNDQDLDNLIFNEKKETDATTQNEQPVIDDDKRDSGDEEGAPRKSSRFDRSSLVNVLPVDKLKNGASTAGKVLGQAVSTIKDKSSAALESAKNSNAGSAISGGLNRAAAVGSEQIGKLKETEAYKRSSSFASSSLERTSVVASGALEKARAGATSGLEKAKAAGSSGLETLKAKVGSDKKSGE